MEITVLGCGVTGLTTAVRFQQEGFQVRIISKALPERTTSAVAAAIWMPFKAEPLKLVNHWSLFSYEKFQQLTKEDDSGVSMVDLLTVSQSNILPGWAGAMPLGTLRQAQLKELPEGYSFGWMTRVPMVETPVYLPFLLRKFKESGGELLQQEVKSLSRLSMSSDLVINCGGLEGGRLVGDKAVIPIRGQIVKVGKLPGVRYIADDDGPNSLAYILPRRDCIILGGTAETGNENLRPDLFTTADILTRCGKLEPRLKKPKVISEAVGLRPGRTSIRLEHEPGTNIIHNYGHGGSGFTVSWGCAEDVLRLIKKAAMDGTE